MVKNNIIVVCIHNHVPLHAWVLDEVWKAENFILQFAEATLDRQLTEDELDTIHNTGRIHDETDPDNKWTIGFLEAERT